jgi:hypothetical protein
VLETHLLPVNSTIAIELLQLLHQQTPNLRIPKITATAIEKEIDGSRQWVGICFLSLFVRRRFISLQNISRRRIRG